MAFPYIGKNKHGVKALIYNHKTAMILNGDYAGQVHDMSVVDNEWFERKYENITADYLRNTYGKVESKEHAGFITMLVKNDGFNIDGEYQDGHNFFVSFDADLRFSKFALPDLIAGRKEITLPLPPKEGEEWPVVGDEAAWGCLTNKCTVIALHDCHAWIKDKDGELETININQLMKPPTPEEDLARLLYCLGGANTDYCEHIARAIINGEIKGLSYKPE